MEQEQMPGCYEQRIVHTLAVRGIELKQATYFSQLSLFCLKLYTKP